MPISQNSDKDQGGSTPNFNKIDDLNWPGSPSDHNPEGVCAPNDHHLDIPEEPESEPTANQNSFQPDPLEVDKGEPDTGIYIPALQVMMKNIQALKDATLEDSGMTPADIDQLKDPQPASGNLDMSDTHLVKVLQHFIYSMDTSHNHYETI
jgi:hypothetical protein